MKLTYNLKNSIFDSFSNPYSATKVSNNSSFMASFVTKTLRWNNNYVLSFVDNHLLDFLYVRERDIKITERGQLFKNLNFKVRKSIFSHME